MGSDSLSVVVVNYNAGKFLVECLASLETASSEINLDIWVVDNASTDNSLKSCKKLFPKFNYIENKENLGFGTANNQALRQIKNELILILNPDTGVNKNTLVFMVNFMKNHPDVGAATCKSLINGKVLDWSSHRGFPTPWASLLYFLGDDRLYHLTDRDISRTHEVDAISGSFFMTRRSVLDKVGFFDEDYWLYAEDIDLCFRIKKVGFKVMFVPDVSIIHLKGVSSGIKAHSQEITTATRDSKMRAFNSFYETMKIFYRKNLSKSYPFFVSWLVYGAIDLKWFLAKRKLHV